MTTRRTGALVIAAVVLAGVGAVVALGDPRDDAETPPKSAKEPPSEAAVAALQASGRPVTLAPAAAEPARSLSDSGGLEPNLAALSAGPAAIDPAAAAPPLIAGEWRDEEGLTYMIAQQGDAYSFRQIRGGAAAGGGQGRIDGRSVRHRLVGDGGEGDCVGRIEPGDSLISGTCIGGGRTWAFRIAR